ncbi:hypothetical protein BGZ61DRAFT_113935 [Ilyonectria robusta]|uniref:uncharacterized protein n=1 Tax=Ilyonectria robusta TaxID=1079257 RepID=UPI001E8D450E|nr:uncharacterized protein BGZ61DRAFT_113935 [Ilyonectria robusta]KAH8670024.1 hypothetical protein BGZ61DRAFT_113935 [Ilyonectria robusta]
MNDGVMDRTSSATWRDPALDARWDRVAGGWSLSASTAAARGPESANPGEATNSGKFPLAGRWRLPGGRYQLCGRRAVGAVGVCAYRSGGMVLDEAEGACKSRGISVVAQADSGISSQVQVAQTRLRCVWVEVDPSAECTPRKSTGAGSAADSCLERKRRRRVRAITDTRGEGARMGVCEETRERRRRRGGKVKEWRWEKNQGGSRAGDCAFLASRN